MNQHKIWHRKATPYHPQANGYVESKNKVIESILTKTINMHRQDWASPFLEALWAYRTTWRNNMGHILYELVYGNNSFFQLNFR